jgi:archaellum component FlaC
MKMTADDKKWNAWCERMEKTQKTLKAENETLTTTCNTLRKQNARLTKDFETQVTCQAEVEKILAWYVLIPE